MVPASQAHPAERSSTPVTYRVDVSDSGSGSGRRKWFAALVLASAAIGVVAAGRQAALAKADREFEARLRAADANRD